MKKKGVFIVGLLCFAIGYIVALDSSGQHESGDEYLKTKVIPRKETMREKGDWGVMDKYTYDQAATYGTENMFTANADLLPGKSVHPPHRHAEEEFLIIARGKGVWTVEDKELAANKGDLLYASPWKIHGLFNNETDTLSFFMMKWQNRGIAAPAEPEGDHVQY